MTEVVARDLVFALQPRGLTREQAATYCGLATDTFDKWVKDGHLPGPFPGSKRWDRKLIDRALDRLSGIADPTEPPSSALEGWRQKRDARKAQRGS